MLLRKAKSEAFYGFLFPAACVRSSMVVCQLLSAARVDLHKTACVNDFSDVFFVVFALSFFNFFKGELGILLLFMISAQLIYDFWVNGFFLDFTHLTIEIKYYITLQISPFPDLKTSQPKRTLSFNSLWTSCSANFI